MRREVIYTAVIVCLSAIITTFYFWRIYYPNIRIEKAEMAIELAIEKHVHTWDGLDNYYDPDIRVFLIPLNKEILQAVITYYSLRETWSKEKVEGFAKDIFSRLLNGEHAIFVMMVYVRKELDPHHIQFSRLKENVFLKNEKQEIFPLEKYTPHIEEPIIEGWTKSLLYFKNFRTKPEENLTYSVHFNGLRVDSKNRDWAGGFIDTEIDFFSELDRGISVAEIRDRHGLNKDDHHMDAIQVVKFFKAVLDAFKAIRGVLPRQ